MWRPIMKGWLSALKIAQEGTRPPSGLHDDSHEKEAAHGNKADAHLRRLGQRHRDAPDQGQYSDKC